MTVVLALVPLAATADPTPTSPVTPASSSSAIISIGNSATIEAQAFAGTSGVIHVNQAAGIGNEQANVVTISLHGTASDAALSSSVAQVRPTLSPAVRSRNNTVYLAPTAFAGASGITQLNQAAGDGNATSNSFTLHLGP